MILILVTAAVHLSHAQRAPAGPPSAKAESYMPVVIKRSLDAIMKADVAEKDKFTQRQRALLEERYDLGNRPSSVCIPAGCRPVQQGVRVVATRSIKGPRP
jgi:hypothetical protein